MIERRAMQRFIVNLPTRITWRNGDTVESDIELFTTNISAGGAYFRTSQPMPIATKVELELRLPFHTHQAGYRSTVKIAGTVVAADAQSMAIAFNSRYKFRPMATCEMHSG